MAVAAPPTRRLSVSVLLLRRATKYALDGFWKRAYTAANRLLPLKLEILTLASTTWSVHEVEPADAFASPDVLVCAKTFVPPPGSGITDQVPVCGVHWAAFPASKLSANSGGLVVKDHSCPTVKPVPISSMCQK